MLHSVANVRVAIGIRNAVRGIEIISESSAVASATVCHYTMLKINENEQKTRKYE